MPASQTLTCGLDPNNAGKLYKGPSRWWNIPMRMHVILSFCNGFQGEGPASE